MEYLILIISMAGIVDFMVMVATVLILQNLKRHLQFKDLLLNSQHKFPPSLFTMLKKVGIFMSEQHSRLY